MAFPAEALLDFGVRGSILVALGLAKRPKVFDETGISDSDGVELEISSSFSCTCEDGAGVGKAIVSAG
jgi:hypothetical protein